MDVAGQATAKLDGTGRLTLPKRFLETDEIGPDGRPKRLEVLWVTPGLDGCLWLLDQVEYRRILRRMRITEIGDPRQRQTQRKFLKYCEKVRPDRQGRISLTEGQSGLAGLEPQGRVLVLGAGRRLELWNPERYEAFDEAVFASDEGKDWTDHLEAVLRRGEEGA